MLPKLIRHRVLYDTPGGPGGGPPADPPGTGERFDRAYVEDLRKESATNRVKARDATAVLSAVGEMLGLDADAMTDVQRVKHAATSLRLAADVEAAINRHGLDRKLTLAVLAQERALADVQPGQPDTGSRLDEVLTKLAKENPALAAGRAPGALRSGLPITGPGAPAVQKISPREIREGHFTPDRVAELQKQGLIDHGGER
jgi:hypothetical protein